MMREPTHVLSLTQQILYFLHLLPIPFERYRTYNIIIIRYNTVDVRLYYN